MRREKGHQKKRERVSSVRCDSSFRRRGAVARRARELGGGRRPGHAQFAGND